MYTLRLFVFASDKRTENKSLQNNQQHTKGFVLIYLKILKKEKNLARKYLFIYLYTLRQQIRKREVQMADRL